MNLGQMSETNRGTEFFTLDAMFQINNSSSMFITKLTYRTAYNFTQQFSLREFTNIKKYYEITFPIGSITTVTDKSQDLSTPSPQGNWIPFRTSKNSKEITFRIDPSLLGITT